MARSTIKIGTARPSQRNGLSAFVGRFSAATRTGAELGRGWMLLMLFDSGRAAQVDDRQGALSAVKPDFQREAISRLSGDERLLLEFALSNAKIT